jgi:hypothetical protein
VKRELFSYALDLRGVAREEPHSIERFRGTFRALAILIIAGNNVAAGTYNARGARACLLRESPAGKGDSRPDYQLLKGCT